MEDNKNTGTEAGDQAQQDNNKVAKKFEQNVKKLVALFSGEKAFKKAKVANSEVSEIIAELTKERKEGLIKDFKDKAGKLLTSKVEFDKFVSQKQKELEQAILNKKKEFNKEMDDCFQIVENIDSLQKEYAKSFEELNGKGGEAN